MRGAFFSELVGKSQTTPVLAIDHDGSREVFHHRKRAAPHIAPVDLQQKWTRIASRLQAHPVIENPAVPAVGCVPDGIIALRLRELFVVRGQVPVLIDRCAKDDFRIKIESGFLNGGAGSCQ